MEIDFVTLMASKSDEGLEEYITNLHKYTPTAVHAAIDELKKRGRVFTNDELAAINADIEKQQEISKQRIEDSGTGMNYWKKNEVTDPAAPEFYSERAIYLFSSLFSVLFGSILLALNINRTGKKVQAWSVVAFGLIYTGTQMYVFSFIEGSTTGLGFMAGLGGALILNHYFWKTSIGAHTKYRPKAIWIPLIIGLVISALIITAYIYTDMHQNPDA